MASVMQSRQKEVLDSVDFFLKTHDQWAEDTTNGGYLNAKFEHAANGMIEICETGDIPGPCREICILAVPRFRLEFEQYQSGEKSQPDGTPAPSFWASVREIVRARQGATPIKAKRPEPVKMLLDAGVSYQQIAFHIYGYHGKGPFIDESGQINMEAIHREASSPGSVVPADWIHPEQAERIKEQEGQFSSRLKSVSRRETGPSSEIDSASIEQLLREGAFVQQIMRVKQCSRDEVIRVAEKLGIKTEESAELNVKSADQIAVPKPVEITPEPPTKPKSATTEEQRQQIIELYTGGMGVVEIATQLKLTTKSVSATLRWEAKRKADESAESAPPAPEAVEDVPDETYAEADDDWNDVVEDETIPANV